MSASLPGPPAAGAGAAAAAALVAALAVTGCGERVPDPPRGVAVRVEPGVAAVEFGRPFPLAVVRTWRAGLEPEPWDDGALAPLRLRPGPVTVRRGGGAVEETRRFDAHAFALAEVRVPAVTVRAPARDGGPAFTARSEPMLLRVRAALDPMRPGLPEPPPDPSPATPGRRRAVALVLAAAAAAAGAAAFLHRRAALARAAAAAAGAAAAAPPPPDLPESRARARLDALRASEPVPADGIPAFHVEAAAALRDLLAERHALPAAERTTEEIDALAAAAGLDAGTRARLAAVLRRADLVKFARSAPDAAARAALLDDAVAVVEAGRPAAAEPRP